MGMARAITVCCCVSMILGLAAAPAAAAEPPARPSDFNGDGYVDLAVGVPLENVGPVVDAGRVSVLYGSATGLKATGNQSWSQGAGGILGASDQDDTFGATLTSADFDADGFADLAIGIPGEAIVDEEPDATVAVIYGSPAGLAAARNQRWTAADIGRTGATSAGFGAALTSGDLNADGFGDLVVGVPFADDASDNPGGVTVLYGSAAGLSSVASDWIGASDAGILNRPGDVSAFGSALATGDLDGDGHDDLAIGAPGARLTGIGQTGVVGVIYGGAGGLDTARVQRWSQDSPGIAGKAETSTPDGVQAIVGELFGWSVAIGNLGGDGYADLAVGVPGESVGGNEGGAVNVIYGTATGLKADGNQIWHQDRSGVPSAMEDGDTFGETLATGDLDGDGIDDLAIGAPGEAIGRGSNEGAVITLRASPTGLRSVGSRLWSQATTGVPGTPESFDSLGTALVSGDYGRGPAEDLAIGVVGEAIGSIAYAGVTDVLYGGSAGVSGVGAQGWSEDRAGVIGVAERGDGFGSSLTP